MCVLRKIHYINVPQIVGITVVEKLIIWVDVISISNQRAKRVAFL